MVQREARRAEERDGADRRPLRRVAVLRWRPPWRSSARRRLPRKTEVRRHFAAEGIPVLPHDLLLRGHLEDASVGARDHERVAVRQSVRAGDEVGVEASLRRVRPGQLLRSVSRAARAREALLRIEGQDELVDRRVLAVRAPVAVVEDENVSCSRATGGDPMRVVLTEEAPVRIGARAVVLRVAVAPQEIATVSALPARVRRRLGRRRRMVEEEDLRETRRGEEDEVVLGVVVDGVRVEPVGIGCARAVARRRGGFASPGLASPALGSSGFAAAGRSCLPLASCPSSAPPA